MDILEQKRRLITSAIITVVLTGMIIATAASAPVIHQTHRLTSELAASVAETKAESVRAILDKYQDLAHQTASRSELARVLEQYATGQVSVGELQAFSRPRLQDAAELMNNLAAIVRYDADGNELVRVGPMANALPEVIPMPDKMDIRQYTLELNGNAPLLHMGSTIYGGDGQPVGHDLLVFTPELLKQVFKSLDNSTLCLVDTTHTQKLAINPHTSQFEITPPDCLKSKANLETLKNTGRLRMRSADGPERLLFLRPLEGYDWQMLMSSEVNQLFAGVFHVIVITGLIILVLSAFSGLVILRAIGPLLQALVDQAAQIARSSEELRLAHRAFEHTREVVAISDASFNIVRANPAFAEIAGLPPRKLYGKNLLDFLDGRHGRVPDLEKLRKQLDVRGAWHGEVWMKGTGDKPLPYLLTASPARNPQGELQHFILSLTNITERVEAEKHMHRLAHYDTLTGLPNRTSLENHLGRAIQQARASGHSFAMMFLDLDRFKPVNDTYGHQVGDELLINVARRLSHNLRSCDIVGRQGGDEFVVITGALNSSDEARTIADKVITALNEPFHIQDRHLQIGASVGVALYPDDGQSADELMRKADRAMYKVKNKGRNSVAFA